jgi:hypothetical protein
MDFAFATCQDAIYAETEESEIAPIRQKLGIVSPHFCRHILQIKGFFFSQIIDLLGKLLSQNEIILYGEIIAYKT